MKSATAISYELDDLVTTVKELTSQIKDKLTFGNNTVAILHGQPDMEIGELSALLGRELGCQVIGGTAGAGAVLTNDGHHELAVVLHVLTADNCLFATAISDSLANEPKMVIENTYKTAYQNLKNQDGSAEPKLIMFFTLIAPSISSDAGLAVLSEVCGSVPIFGYNAADDFEFCKQQVFLDGEVGGDRIGLLLIAGDINPIFVVGNLEGKETLDKCHVTKAAGSIIYEIDGKPAYEYIKSFPFIDDETPNLLNYQFFVEMKNADDDDGVPVSRALYTFNKESGEVISYADVPQDSYIGLRYCEGNDVKTSTKDSLKDFSQRLKKAGGNYSTVLIATCTLRSMYLADQKDAEGIMIKDMLPPNLTVSGLYAFGEVAPTSVRNGKAVNRFHNATFTVCAF